MTNKWLFQTPSLEFQFSRLEEFQKHLGKRERLGYPRTLITLTRSELQFETREAALQQKPDKGQNGFSSWKQYQ